MSLKSRVARLEGIRAPKQATIWDMFAGVAAMDELPAETIAELRAIATKDHVFDQVERDLERMLGETVAEVGGIEETSSEGDDHA